MNDWWWAECWAFSVRHLFRGAVAPQAVPGHRRNAFWRGLHTLKPVPPSTPAHPPETDAPMIRNVGKCLTVMVNGLVNNELNGKRTRYYQTNSLCKYLWVNELEFTHQGIWKTFYETKVQDFETCWMSALSDWSGKKRNSKSFSPLREKMKRIDWYVFIMYSCMRNPQLPSALFSRSFPAGI